MRTATGRQRSLGQPRQASPGQQIQIGIILCIVGCGLFASGGFWGISQKNFVASPAHSDLCDPNSPPEAEIDTFVSLWLGPITLALIGSLVSLEGLKKMKRQAL